MSLSKFLRQIVFVVAVLLLPSGVGVALAAPEVQQQGNVSFVSGGVGVTEMQEIKALAADYSLELLFVTQGKPRRYLSSIKVQIKDAGGKVVLETESRGPVLLAKLPAGRYAVSAESDGKINRRTVQAGGRKSQRAVFVWDQPVDR
jgi:hypothetical protein